MQNEVKKSLQEFSFLSKACIDSSSLIYMQKANFFDMISKTLSFITIPEVFKEVGTTYQNILLYNKPQNDTLSTDDKLIECVKQLNIPIISEDKQILKNVKNLNLPYYNSLMMLNFLLYKKIIRLNKYYILKTRLIKIARYSDEIFLFSEKLVKLIIKGNY